MNRRKMIRTGVTGMLAGAALAMCVPTSRAMDYPPSQPLPGDAPVQTQQRQQLPENMAGTLAAAPAPQRPHSNVQAQPTVEHAANPAPNPKPIVDDVRPIIESGQARVQIAILLDNSGSMSGLINQAKTELWKVVNEFIKAKVNGHAPHLEVALFTYGSPPPKLVVPMTDNLDRVSEELFKVTISGGDEYCGMTIDSAVKQLSWAEGNNDLKLIFIAGNEPFTQGPVDYREACSAAIGKGIIVNTIHCGSGIPADWRDGAVLADGRAMNIDQNAAVVHIDAPQDAEIAKLGAELNTTYVPYGQAGQLGARRQELQDSNAEAAAPAAAVERAVTKSSAYYRNSGWDLVDALKDGRVKLADVAEKDLPENLRKMNNEQRAAWVAEQGKKRAEIQKKIAELGAARDRFVGEKRKELAEAKGEQTLDAALIQAIRETAAKKGYQFEK
ncbi:MAG: VWA domain-containing protein [Phycisphaera sp.]|nr:VWA domain-containing protein [Phycisphaera sp.]